MNRPNPHLVRRNSVITFVMALSAACSSRTGEPSEPTASEPTEDRAAPDAARSFSDASSSGATHRIDAGQTHGTSETASTTPNGSETLQSFADSGTQSGAVQSQTTQPDAAQSDTTDSDPDGSAACSVELDESVAEHACFHISYGPFIAVAAATDGAVAELRETHTTYTVTLPGPTSTGVVGLRLPRTGLYAMFSDVALPLLVNDGPNVLPPTHQQLVRGCDEFAAVVVLALEAGRPYSLWLGPGATHVQLVFEQTYPDALNQVCGEPPDVNRDSGVASNGETRSTQATVTANTSANDSTDPANTFATEVTTEATTAASSEDARTCGALKSACLTGDECCSGRCFARQCVTPECRTDGYCENNDQCCSYCHFGDSPHCH